MPGNVSLIADLRAGKSCNAEAATALEEEGKLVDNLAAMVMRLCGRLTRFDPDAKTINDAVDLLKRNGLSSPLRKSN